VSMSTGQADRQTDGRTDGWTPGRYITLSATDAASVIKMGCDKITVSDVISTLQKYLSTGTKYRARSTLT